MELKKTTHVLSTEDENEMKRKQNEQIKGIRYYLPLEVDEDTLMQLSGHGVNHPEPKKDELDSEDSQR